MFKRIVISIGCVVGLSAVCPAENLIEEWGQAPGIQYSINQFNHTVLILAPGTYKFQATDDGALGHIEWINIDDAVTGSVELYILRKPAEDGGPGAHDVDLVNLSGSTTARIAEFSITGDLGTDGPTHADNAGALSIGGDVVNAIEIGDEITALTIAGHLGGNLTCGTLVAGTIGGDVLATSTVTIGSVQSLDIGRDLLGYLSLPNGIQFPHPLLRTVHVSRYLVGTIDLHGAGVGSRGSLRVEHGGPGHLVNGGTVKGGIWLSTTGDAFSGTATVTSLEGGELEVHGVMSGTLETGNIVQGGQIWLPGAPVSPNFPVSGQITVTDYVSADSQITIADAQGLVQIGGNLDGLVQVTNDVWGRPDGLANIAIAGSVTATGRILINDDLGGPDKNPLGGRIVVGQTLSGDILIKGGFLDRTGYPEPEIEISGGKTAAARFVVNYDAVNLSNDGWQSGATARIGGVDYPPPDLPFNIAAIFCVKGDIYPDGVVNVFDIDPFIEALVDPDAYVASHRYIEGGFTYVVDMSCDGVFDAFDIDPFVERLNDPNSYIWCEVCPGPGGDSLGEELADESDPAAVAALFKEYVAPERLPVVVAIAKELAVVYAGTPKGDFWAAVLKELYI